MEKELKILRAHLKESQNVIQELHREKFVLYPEIRLLQRKCELHESMLLQLNKERQEDRIMIAHLLNEVRLLKEQNLQNSFHSLHEACIVDSDQEEGEGKRQQQQSSIVELSPSPNNPNHLPDRSFHATIIQKWWRGHRCRLIFNRMWLNYRLHRFKILFYTLKIEQFLRRCLDNKRKKLYGETSLSSVSTSSPLDSDSDVSD